MSPTWRTRHTILPYLKASGQTAEIWPELIESGKVPSMDAFPKEAPSATLFEGTEPIVLPEAEKLFFHLRADESGQKLLNPASPEDALALAKRTEELLRARFSDKDATVLLVGHGNASMPMVRQLTRDPSFTGKHLDNTCMWLAREQKGGAFALEHYNRGVNVVVPQAANSAKATDPAAEGKK